MSRATLKSTDDLRARQLAQSDPVPNLTQAWGDCAANARKAVDRLTLCLRALDNAEAQLRKHDLTVSVDLGPIGNAAAAARRDLERERPAQFRMPTGDDRG